MTSIKSDSKSDVLSYIEKSQASSQLEIEDPNEENRTPTFAENDPRNPHNWPALQKWLIVIAVWLMYLVSYVAIVTVIPAAPEVIRDLKVDTSLYQTLLVTIWELGEGFAPFLIAPLSERYGRLPVMHTCNVLGLVYSIIGASSKNISVLIAFRFMNGTVSVALTLAPAVVGDLFSREERGRAMAVGTGLGMMGLFVGPIAGAFITDAAGWRWTFWLNSILFGTVTVFAGIVLRETYAPRILERQMATTTNTKVRWTSLPSHERRRVAGEAFRTMTRPIRMFFTSPILFVVAICSAFVYGIAYVNLTLLTTVMEDRYGFSQNAVGLAFLGPAIGSVLGIILYGLTSDRYVRYRNAKEAEPRPEHRLVYTVIGAIILPIGMLIWGWSTQYRVQYIVPLIGTGFGGFCCLVVTLSTQTYLTDVFEPHSASALAVVVILRAIFGTLFPLCGPPLTDKLGLGWGYSLLAFIAISFIPLVFLLAMYGHKLRENGLRCKSASKDSSTAGSVTETETETNAV